MSDAAASTFISTSSGDPAGAESAVVSFADNANAAVEFTDAPPSEWAFAAHEAAFDGEAIDTVREPASTGLMPLVAVATFVIAETDLYADAEDALVAMAPTPLAFDAASVASAAAAAADPGMVMWSGDNGESDGIAGPVASYARGETALALHDVAPHGISLDWTDAILG